MHGKQDAPKQYRGTMTRLPCMTVKMAATTLALYSGQKETRIPLLTSLVIVQSLFHLQFEWGNITEQFMSGRVETRKGCMHFWVSLSSVSAWQ